MVSLCSLGLQTRYLLNAGASGVCHHTQLPFIFCKIYRALNLGEFFFFFERAVFTWLFDLTQEHGNKGHLTLFVIFSNQLSS